MAVCRAGQFIQMRRRRKIVIDRSQERCINSNLATIGGDKKKERGTERERDDITASSFNLEPPFSVFQFPFVVFVALLFSFVSAFYLLKI
jgi:hypothetical protein